MFIARKNARGERPEEERGARTLEQRNFDFWFKECQRLHASASEAFKLGQRERFLEVAASYKTAARRFVLSALHYRLDARSQWL